MSVSLGNASSFAVLAYSSITNTGATTIYGDIGLYPGSSYTGSGTVTQIDGSTYTSGSDVIAQNAKTDLTSAFGVAAGATPTSSGYGDLTGYTLTPGVYSSGALSLSLTGTLYLNGAGTYIFQASSTLTFNPGATVVLMNGACVDDIFWQVSSSATLSAGSVLYGNILALTSITLDSGASVFGRVLVLNGSVTMQSNLIDNTSTCPTTTEEPIMRRKCCSHCAPKMCCKIIFNRCDKCGRKHKSHSNSSHGSHSSRSSRSSRSSHRHNNHRNHKSHSDNSSNHRSLALNKQPLIRQYSKHEAPRDNTVGIFSKHEAPRI